MSGDGFYISNAAYAREQQRHMERWKKKEEKQMAKEKEIEKLKKSAMLGINPIESEAE